MNTLHFKYALEVERTRSITQAADNLYMAQPNLSKAIRELEDNVGFAIFDRTPKGVIPTPQGAEFLEYARKIVAQLDKIQLLQRSVNPDRLSLKVALANGSYASHALKAFIAELDTDKDIDVNVMESDAVLTIDGVSERRYNFGIIRYRTEHENYFIDYLSDKELVHDLVWEYDYLLLLSNQSPLAELEELRYSSLSGFIELLSGHPSVPYLSQYDMKKNAASNKTGKRIYIFDRYSQLELLSHLPNAYMWVPPCHDEMLDRFGLIQRRCRISNRKSKDVLIYPKGYQFSPLEKKFLDKIYESRNALAFREYN